MRQTYRFILTQWQVGFGCANAGADVAAMDPASIATPAKARKKVFMPEAPLALSPFLVHQRLERYKLASRHAIHKLDTAPISV